MPPNPEPDEDYLDTAPPPSPVLHVEQALLGALLLEPQRLRDLTGIGPTSFSTAAHRALFAALASQPAPDPAQHAKDTQWLRDVLATAQEQARGLSAPYLHTLVQASRWPQHATVYASIIEAEHARRRLSGAAHQLLHTLQDATLPQPLASVLAEADALTAVVDDIGDRFPPHAGSLPRTPAPPSTPLDTGIDAVEDERLLLATATASPDRIGPMRWLVPSDFTVALHAGLWQCLTTLSRRGTPVDPVTVLWEAQQRGVLRATAPRELLGLLSGSFGEPEYWGERIVQRSVLATVHRVGARIVAFTADPGTTPYQLVVGSRRALADLSAARTRWNHATSPPARTKRPSPARTSAASRAGPPTTTPPSSTRATR